MRFTKTKSRLTWGVKCWGPDGEGAAVLDHHFYREEGQFPSASSAVLHNAARIYETFGRPPVDKEGAAAGSSVFWLVTHRQPDFDAFCAMYCGAA